MIGFASSFQWTGTTVSEHDCSGVPLCPSSSFLAGFAHWSLVCHVQHPIPGDETTRLCYDITRGSLCTHIPSSENWVGSLVTGDVCVCVPWLSV